jgi:hypothetical protein
MMKYLYPNFPSPSISILSYDSAQRADPPEFRIALRRSHVTRRTTTEVGKRSKAWSLHTRRIGEIGDTPRYSTLHERGARSPASEEKDMTNSKLQAALDELERLCDTVKGFK